MNSQMQRRTALTIKVLRGPSGGWHARFDGYQTTAGGFRTRTEAKRRLLRLAADALEHHQLHVLACANGAVLVVRWLVDGWVVEECSQRRAVASPCQWVRYQTAREALAAAREETKRRGGIAWESTA